MHTDLYVSCALNTVRWLFFIMEYRKVCTYRVNIRFRSKFYHSVSIEMEDNNSIASTASRNARLNLKLAHSIRS